MKLGREGFSDIIGTPQGLGWRDCCYASLNRGRESDPAGQAVMSTSRPRPPVGAPRGRSPPLLENPAEPCCRAVFVTAVGGTGTCARDCACTAAWVSSRGVLVGKGGVLIGDIDMGRLWIPAYHSTLIWGKPERVARANRRDFAGGISVTPVRG